MNSALSQPGLARSARWLVAFLALLSWLAPSAQATIWYADNNYGDASFDGLSAVITNGHGPKRYIADAIAVAASGNQISAAAGLYQESSWNLDDKSLTLLLPGQATIVDYDPGQTDTDGDGIPDWWMLKYFGHPTGQTSDQSCASCYYNGNPLTNLQEYDDHLDPTNTCPALVPYTANYQTNIVCKIVNWDGDLVVGSSNTYADVLLIQNGGALLSSGDSYLSYNFHSGLDVSSSNNFVLVTGPGSVWSNANGLYVGIGGIGNNLVISNGGAVFDYLATLGPYATSSNNSVLVTGPGSVWNSDGVYFYGGSNSLVVSEGGQLVSGGADVEGGGDSVLVTGSGSVWSNASYLRVGYVGDNLLVVSNGAQIVVGNDLSLGEEDEDNSASNSLLIANGGQVTSVSGWVGSNEGGYDTVLVTDTGSVWSIAGDLEFGGSSGSNTLEISNGGQVVDNQCFVGSDCEGADPTNNVLVTGPGSVWNNLSGLYIGVAPTPCSAALVVSNAGAVVATNMVIGDVTAGTQNPVTVNGGRLIVTGPLGTGLLEVRGGMLTVNDGTCTIDTLLMDTTPSSTLVYNGGTLTVGTALLNGTLQFALGTNSRPIAVTGNMVLDAYINITDGGGLTNGTYTLFTYGGTLTYDGTLVQMAPNTNLAYVVDTSTNGQVNLVVSPACLTNITILLPQSNTVSDVTNISVQVCLPGNQELGGIYFLLDGEPSMSIVEPGWSNDLVSAEWDTVCVTNGWHTLQAFVSYSDGFGDSSEFASPIIWVQTQNDIILPGFPTVFGTSLPITALLPSSNATWTVNILDPSNNTLRTYSDSTTTGRIDIVWDGNDSNGVSFSGDYVLVQVSTLPAGGGNPQVMRPAPKGTVGGYPNGFLLSYEGDLIYGWGGTLPASFNEMMWEITDIAGSDPYYTTGPTTYNEIGEGDAGVQTPAVWQSWLGWLSDPGTANLYYFGHGDAEAVGGSSGASASKQAIGDALGNGYTRLWWWPFKKLYHVKHTYRFVYLDGCDTASGDLCVAFGIERIRTNDTYYAANGIQPQAFLGWTNIMQYALVTHADFNADLAAFDDGVFYNWSQGQTPLIGAVNQARAPYTSSLPVPAIWGDQQLRWNPQ